MLGRRPGAVKARPVGSSLDFTIQHLYCLAAFLRAGTAEAEVIHTMDVSTVHEREAQRVLVLLETLANSTFRQAVWRRAGDHALNYSQAQVLAYVGRHPGCHMGDVAKAFAVTLSAITQSVDRLEEKGLLARGRDPADRRVYVLHATARGLAVAGERERFRLAALGPVLSRMSARDRSQVVRGLEALVAAATDRLSTAARPAGRASAARGDGRRSRPRPMPARAIR
jgi:DNA-binding MarR family transcriptional regulator